MPNPREPDRRPPEQFTLRDVVEQRLMLVFECASCIRSSRVDILAVIGRLGPDTLVSAAMPRARCRRCGAKSARALLGDPVRRNTVTWWPHEPNWRR